MSLPPYRELRVLAEHDAVRTSLAEDEATGERVVVRTLSLKKAASHEEVELFERESTVLEHLDHPRLPRILARDRDDEGDDVRLHQVRAYVDGQSLFEEIDGGRHLTEREALSTALSVAETLAYLHDRSPALVHRDIKPQNLIRTRDDALDTTTVTVIDLGAIKAGPSTGRTIVGTYGYMPPEQFEGRSTPASDVFALGMTLIFLLTHKEPGDFDDGGAREHFRKEANVSAAAATLIESMIAYDPSQRPKDGADVARRLREVLNPPTPASQPKKKPKRAVKRAERSAPPVSQDNEGRSNSVVTVVMVVFFIGFALVVGVVSLWDDLSDDDEPPPVPPAEIQVEAPPPPAPAPVLGFDLRDRHLIRCSSRLFPRLRQSEARYQSWVSVGGPTGDERHIYGLYAGYDDAKLSCAVDAELGALAERALTLVAEASRYYAEEDHADDGFAKGRELHPQLLEVFGALRLAEAKLTNELSARVLALEPDASDPQASDVRACLRDGWLMAFGADGAPPPIVAAEALRELEAKLTERLGRLVVDGPRPGSTEPVSLMANAIEHYRRDIKRMRRDQSQARTPAPEVQRRALQDRTVELLSQLELIERTNLRHR